MGCFSTKSFVTLLFFLNIVIQFGIIFLIQDLSFDQSDYENHYDEVSLNVFMYTFNTFTVVPNTYTSVCKITSV